MDGHVFGRGTKKANPQYISVNWEASGGGAFAVVPLNEKGKLPDHIPLFRGHTAPVLDTDWSPFDDSFIASGSDDGKVFLWKVPEGFTVRPETEEPPDVSPVVKLSGHSRKVGHVLFNPSAQNVLASSSGDYTVKIWDVEGGSSKLALKHGDIVQSLSWSANGSLLVTTCRDKKLRIWDVRQEKPAVEVAGHSGAKNSRVVWMGEHDRVATTGFSKMSDRQLGLWDIRASREPIDGFQILDQISGVCMPFWDDGTQCLYLAGKGDGNIRYYEYTNDKFEYLSQHTSSEPQRGIAFLPKRGINLHENEITRAFKTVNDHYVEPVSFIVPRRAEVFQEDVYPPTVGTKPAMSASEWFGGKEGLPPKFSLESVYEGGAPKEMPGDYKAPSTAPRANAATPTTPAPTKTEPPPPKAEPEPAPAPAPVAREPPPSMKDNQASIANMADKFNDKDTVESSSDEETSSFEEVQKPGDLRALAGGSDTPHARKSSLESFKPPPVTTTASARAPAPSAGFASPPATIAESNPPPSSALPKASDQPPTSAHRTTPSTGSAGGAADGLRSHLADIKSMLETQNQTIKTQSEQLDRLTREMEAMKPGTGAAGETDLRKGFEAREQGMSKEEQIGWLEEELKRRRG
ncbi:MAG: Coronin-like protein crn1 [Chrysothrix sp. TS-e1954]|nr:MAG: Coronin-like protein crn1 [Chrysothrix sp. TS-e1954]